MSKAGNYQWLQGIIESFDAIIAKIDSGEINIDEVERIHLISENYQFKGGTQELIDAQQNLIVHINHYFTRLVKEQGELDKLEKVAIESAIKRIMNQIREILFN